MKFLPDQVVARLQNQIQTPDLSGTRYRALQYLGSGGMGTVWLAEDEVLHRTVALKILTTESSSTDLAARLMQEATVLARLEHPGIAPIHDAGTLPDGRTFYCMKYVEGRTLDQHIVGMGLRQRLHLLQRIAEPLAFAHSRGIIHRDLKPSNIMVGAFGEVLVMDWGLAKVSGNALSNATNINPSDTKTRSLETAATEHGAVLGTPGFMAPEQNRGDISMIDQRTDVFGLGAIMNFMLGQKIGGSQSEIVPKRLLAIARKATATEMSARYSSVQEMADDLGRYLDDMPVKAYRENALERTARTLSRNRVAVVLILAYLLMRLLFIFFQSLG